MIESYADFVARAKTRILHQDDAVERLAVILYFHQQAMNDFGKYINDLDYYHKVIAELQNGEGQISSLPNPPSKPEPMGSPPIFLLGQTGSGKTHLVRELCQLSGVNFLSINATHLSNAGYKGMTLADVGQMLVEQVGDDVAKRLFSVIFFDEFDKLFMPMSDYQASHRQGLATELLTLFEGTSLFPLVDDSGIESGYMLFILGGSFGLHNNKENSIGFLASDKQKFVPQKQADFLKMGFFDELAGRIGQVISLAPLDKKILADILKQSPSSPFVRLKNRLKPYLKEVQISDAFIDELIDSHQDDIKKFGVRGLYQAFNALPYTNEILQEVARQGEKVDCYVMSEQGLVRQYASDNGDLMLLAHDKSVSGNVFEKWFGG